MRNPLALLFLCLCTSLGAAEVGFVRVWPEYRSAASFQRIAEFFGGTEDRGREVVMRSQKDQRDGYYFLIRMKSDAALAGSVLALKVILPGEEEPSVHFFPVQMKKGSEAFLVGLTGDDWPDAKVVPVAWEVSLLGKDGAELTRKSSYLWE